jgi:hypothetical protein
VVKNIFVLVDGVVVGIAQPGLNHARLVGNGMKVGAADMKPNRKSFL